MATNGYGCNEGLIQNASAHKHTTKSINIQLVLGPEWLSLKFYKRLVGERRKLQTEVLLVLSSNSIYVVSFGEIKFGDCITPLGLQPNQLMSFRNCTDGHRTPRFFKCMLILFPTKLNSREHSPEQDDINIWVCVMVWWLIILSSKFCPPPFPRLWWIQHCWLCVQQHLAN